MSNPITSLEYHRRAAGLTTTELSESSGVSRVQLSKYENRLHTPTLATAHKIADALGVAPDILFPRDGRWGPMEVLDAWYRRAEEKSERPPDDPGYIERLLRSDEEEGERRRALHEHQMGQADDKALTGGPHRDSYYRRQDPATYRPLTWRSDDGRVLREEPPAWFARKMKQSGKARA